MADEANKPLNADEISEDDLRAVVGGSTPINVQEINVVENLTIEPPTQSSPGKVNAGWDIAKNSTP
jgi:hypothetical protein